MRNIEEKSKLLDAINNSVGLMVYFYNETCAPCIILRPKIIEMMEEFFPKMDLLFINSTLKDITAEFQVYENPTILVFFEQKEYIRKSKYVSIQELKESIQRYYSMVY